MNGVRVSVALATRDGARYLPAQLDSILGQTRSVDHIVVSDDASGDDTIAYVRSRLEASGIAHVVLANDRPLGVVKNFESALAACDGDIVLLSDQDDVWHPERVAASIAVLDDPHWLALHTDARLVDAAGRPLGLDLLDALEVPARVRAQIVAGESFAAFLRRNLATGATMAIRRELLDLALPVPSDWVHDEWLAIMAAARGRLTLIDRPLLDYRQHGANQIGVAEPSMRAKIRRVLAPRGERNRTLARRAAQLTQRLDAIDVPAGVRAEAAHKSRVEEQRATLPAARPLRLPRVLKLLLTGSYRYASRGRADVVRDLLQPW